MGNNKSIGRIFRKEYPRVYEYIKGDYTYFRIDCRGNGWTGKPYEQRATKELALERAREIADKLGRLGAEGVIQDEEARLYRQYKLRAGSFGMTIGDIIEDWVTFRSGDLRNAMTKRTNDLADEWLKEKKTNRLKPLAAKSLEQLETTRKQLIEAFNDMPIGTITRTNVEYAYGVWEAAGIKLSTIKNNYGKMFKSFFEWCIRKEYIKKNPAKDIEIKAPQRDVLIYSISDAETICNRLRTEAKNKKMTPYIVLSMFCGLRPNEAAQMTWDNINFETKEITVKGRMSKVRRTRHVPMSDNVIAWLKPWKGKPIGNFKNFRKRFESVKRELPQQADILRHTAISFWMAKHKDMEKVAFIMGNSPATIKEHYLEGVRDTDVEKFFALAP